MQFQLPCNFFQPGYSSKCCLSSFNTGCFFHEKNGDGPQLYHQVHKTLHHADGWQRSAEGRGGAGRVGVQHFVSPRDQNGVGNRSRNPLKMICGMFVVSIRWLGAIRSAWGTHIPYIFPMENGEPRSYWELPNHLICGGNIQWREYWVQGGFALKEMSTSEGSHHSPKKNIHILWQFLCWCIRDYPMKYTDYYT